MVLVEVKYENGYAFVDDYKFRKDADSGYYLSTRKIGTSRKRLHVYMWEKHNGKVPKGYEIHHKDEDKNNNEIDNLMCMTRKEHLKWHSENISPELVEKQMRNLEKARKAAVKWHKSEEGKEWHRSQANTRFKHDRKFDLTCAVCGKSYTSPKQWSKFCSRACAAKDRRDSGLDDERRLCVICNNNFMINKYSTRKACSKACTSKLLSKNNWKRRSQ